MFRLIQTTLLSQRAFQLDAALTLFRQSSSILNPTLMSTAPSATITQWRGMAKSTLKTNKSAAKRFRVRGNGSIVRNRSGASHNTGHKKRARCNRLATSCSIKGKKIEKRMRQLIGA
mmetsp:Transcript_5851/g.8458  ORF Transcript_5851/g.8458 Transcript_5851/m.8458 type:complete len:117 (+) Transcript_5851:48-398(+)